MTFIKDAFKTGKYDWAVFLLVCIAVVASTEWIVWHDPELPALFLLLAAASRGFVPLLGKFEAGAARWLIQLLRAGCVATGCLAFGMMAMVKGFQTDPRTVKAWSQISPLRSALSIYYGDAEGRYPATLEALVPKYYGAIPVIKLPATNRFVIAPRYHHPPTAKVEYYDSKKGRELKIDRDTGGWAYVRSGPRAGELAIDCTHKNTRGVTWVEWSAE